MNSKMQQQCILTKPSRSLNRHDVPVTFGPVFGVVKSIYRCNESILNTCLQKYFHCIFKKNKLYDVSNLFTYCHLIGLGKINLVPFILKISMNTTYCLLPLT